MLTTMMAMEEFMFMSRGGGDELRRKAKEHLGPSCNTTTTGHPPPRLKRKAAAAAANSSSSTGNGEDISDAENPMALGGPQRAPARCHKWGSLSAINAQLDKSAAKKKKPSRVLQPRLKDSAAAAAVVPSSCPARTILAVLMENNILPRRAKLSSRLKKGTLTSQGSIGCTCGCGMPFTVADFAAHALAATQRPSSANVFLGDGRSLPECLVQLMRKKKNGCSTPSSSGAPRVKRKCGAELENGDWLCSVCADGGNLVLCECCPSAFHLGCVGLEATPEEDWFCPSCRCPICDSGEFEPPAAHDDDDDEFTDKTVIYCDQCERQFHVGCIKRNRDQVPRKGQPWLCNHACSNIFSRLQGLVGSSFPTSQEGISFTLLRSSKLPHQEEAMAAEEHAKLTMAFDVLHECFVTLIEPHTQSDLTHDIVFNRESWLRRLNFRGFYVVGLEKGGELITVGTLRVYGNKVAELPLVGTRFAHRRQGMCRLLMNNLEMLLGELGVERLVLPAVPKLLKTWTGSFGFEVMTQSDKMEIADHTILYFQGTTMCQKFINNEAAPQR